MPDLWMDVDAALTEVPINIMPLLDDTDFKSREESVAYNAAGLELIWHFTTTAGATTATVVTPTTGGNYDWAHQDGGMYTIEIPASGGASINNDTEGFGWFTGVATGVLPWRGPVIGFRAAGLNNVLIDSAYSATRGLAGTALPDAAADAAGGLPISDAGGLNLDAQIGTDIDAILVDTGTTLQGELDGIQADTEDIQSRIPAALVGGRIAADVGSISGDATAADNLEAACDGTSYNIGGGAVVAASVTGAVGSVTGAVGSVTGAVGSVTGAVGSVTGNVGGNVIGSVGSVAAGGITAASIATGAIDADAIADNAIDAGAIAADAITAAKLATGAITADAFAADAIVAATLATGAISSDAFAAGVITVFVIAVDAIGASELAADAVAEIADAVWDEAIAGHAGAGSTGAALSAATAPTAAAVADAVWDELTADHTGVGSAGAALAAAGGSGDPWSTALPGSYGAGTAGYIIGSNLNAPVGTVDTVVDAIKAKTDNLPSDPADESSLEAAITAATSPLATSAELAKVPKSDSTVSWNATALAAIQTQAAGALTAYDPPTKAELDAAVSPLATAANLATVDTVVDGLATTIGVAGAGLTAVPWNASWDAEVQSEVDDALGAAITEPTNLAATKSVKSFLWYLYSRLFHRNTQTATQQITYKADGVTALATRTVSDDGTTQTLGAGA